MLRGAGGAEIPRTGRQLLPHQPGRLGLSWRDIRDREAIRTRVWDSWELHLLEDDVRRWGRFVDESDGLSRSAGGERVGAVTPAFDASVHALVPGADAEERRDPAGFQVQFAGGDRERETLYGLYRIRRQR